ncbi:MAG: Clp protease N-terminal domain-containing protein [Egibacteraceae bacterium]
MGLDNVEVGPLFVALLAAPESAAARTLTGPDLSVEQLRAALGEDVERPAPGDATPLPLSASARAALHSAAATRAGGAVGTGHIARALVSDDAIAALLRAAGADVGSVREAAARLDGDSGLP